MGDWFENVFGFREHCRYTRGRCDRAGYDQTTEMFKYEPETGILTSATAKREFVAGRFETPSLEELRARVDLDQAGRELGDLELQVVELVADVTELHVLPENCGALFQAASQFNVLEHTSEDGLPEHGITCYSSDRTQGPACAIACAPGTVVRNYFAFGHRGQTAERQVTNLADVEELLENEKNRYFTVTSGYTLAERAGLHKLAAVLRGNDELKEEIRRKLRIGVQADTEVVASRFGSELYEGPPGQQLVTQAYCSAVSVSYSGCRAGDWEEFAATVLESAYESTLYAAVENALRNPDKPGSKKVFLTALGGGVFGNDMGWVRLAMARAFERFRDVGLDVVLVSFGRSTPEFARLATARPTPESARGRGAE